MYRVILADDESKFRTWLRSILDASEHFHVVGEAANGQDTMDLIASLAPDVLIADIYMPEPDGFELARYLQDHFPDVKAILISSHEERTYQRLAIEDGALTFIPKAKLSADALYQALHTGR